ncbi:hypothetical protein K7I13_07245 [Brucepastera parasyntrophica]|uniref:hypothetical protein n=1 Tax=Brucepastera parasyntrophica TaxID=2880008 RepID=UPI00210A8656|nr:hypothetical protein [Brucepastera parasyntrophica]ULQ61039.1 hypothetical protein K7I13_07245 [Brucepastera parasyntrophica]
MEKILQEGYQIGLLLTLLGIVISILQLKIYRENNKHNVSTIIGTLKIEYEAVICCIKKANDEIKDLLMELKETPVNSLKGNIDAIFFDEGKYVYYKKVQQFYEALGAYVYLNKKLFRPAFMLFIFNDEFWEKNQEVINFVKTHHLIEDFCTNSYYLYDKYEKERKRSLLARKIRYLGLK